jgi:UDP-3-O-[3-hydroxymyristoyl] glucosamine N-acyltransferase
MKVRELAAALDCVVNYGEHGEEDAEVTGVRGIDDAGPGHITFLSNAKYAPKLKSTHASAVIATQPVAGIPTLISSNPYLDFARALELFYQAPRLTPGIHPSAAIAATARIGEGAAIGAFVAVGDSVVIGRNAVLHPHVVIYEGAVIGDNFTAHSHSVVREFCRIGDRVILQNGVVVGGDGFGFAKRADGKHHKIVQSGITVVEDDVEVQSLTSIDRATFGETRVGRGAKIDSLVQIGHNCVVGEDNIICSQTGLAGSSVTEKNVLLAGQVGLSGHLTVHEGAIVYAQSGIGGDVKANSRVSGSPAFEASEWLRAITAFQKLPEILRTVRDLKKDVAGLKAEGAGTEENPTGTNPTS